MRTQTNSRTDNPGLDVLIMAAGLGTRMRSARAKVLHKLGGRPLISHICRAAFALNPRRIYVVVGRQADAEIGMREIAAAIGTIPYELLCRVGTRIERMYDHRPSDLDP